MSFSSRRSIGILLAVPLLLASCSSAGPSSAGPSSAGSSPSASTPAKSTALASGSSMAQAPSAPTDFIALIENGSVPCPSPDPSQSDASCKQTNLSWTYTSAPDTSFRIYAVSIGEDPTATCEASSAQASAVLDTKPAITSAHLFNEVSVGGGAQCLWITAVNAAGESPRVAPQGQH